MSEQEVHEKKKRESSSTAPKTEASSHGPPKHSESDIPVPVSIARKSKSGVKSVTRISSSQRSKLGLQSSSSSKVRKKKTSVTVSDEGKLDEVPPTEEAASSSEESSSEEEKEKKPKKTKKKKLGAVSEDVMRKAKKDMKGVKLKLGDDKEDEDGEPTEEELIADFIKSKTGSWKPIPPLPDPVVMLEEAMVKIMKKKGLTTDQIEELRLEKETEINKKVEAEKQKRQEELDRMMEKERRDIIDTQLREDQLTKSVNIIKNVVQHFRENFRIEKEQQEWQLYLQCRKLPTPALCNQMTTYLNIWEENMTFITIPEASEKTQEVMELINDLEEVIALATEDEAPKIPNWFWIRQLFRDYQSLCLDIATYRLLRNVSKNLDRINIPTARYNFKDPYVTICVWLRVQNPIPLTNPRRPPRPRIEISFRELDKLKVILPYVLDCEKKAVRVMYLKYDHLSDTCEYSNSPPIPPHYEIDLLTTCKQEWRLKLRYKYARRDKKVPPEPDPDDPEPEPWIPEPEEFDSDEEIPIVPYKNLNPTPSEYLSLLEEQKNVRAKKMLVLNVPPEPHIINLRKYSVLGGVYAVHYLHQPPQPQDYATMAHIQTTRLFTPKELVHVDFMVEYEPPAIYYYVDFNARRLPDPEIIEMFKQQQEELDKLIFVSLKWTQDIIFLQMPTVCVWVEDMKCWSTKYVHDTKYDEENMRLSFRTQMFGIFGLINLRYSNLPYQTWEITPQIDGSVTINITTSVLILEFIIKDGLICLSLLENSPNKAFQKEVGKFFKFHTLKKMLKETGIDIFPEADAHCYIEGSCEKHWPMEKHLYTNMAAMCGVFNFAWSKWNITQGRRNIVMQMREYAPDSPKQKNHSLMLATPLKVVYVKCTEDSIDFSNEPMEGLKSNYNEARKSFMSKIPDDPNILNLRKNTVLGGVYHVNYLHQPPQSQDFASMPNTHITRLYLPKKLRHVDFIANYEPPATTDPNIRKQPEQIEEEMKKQEEALDGLLYIDLTWPQHVIFLELPIVAVWVKEQKHWSKKYVHDLKHNEEKGTLSFRTQIFGIFGLATLRYANLPYQGWDIKPELDGSVTINITSAMLILEFVIKDGLVCLSQLQNSPNKALLDKIGKFMKLHVLKKMLKQTGIDIFPDPDVYCYLEGGCEKHWPMEKHLYSNMAALCGVYNFAWSRWNLAQGRNNIVLQMREYAPEKTKQKIHSTLLVTPIKAYFINCTEVSQVFSDEPIEGLKFNADLYTLMRNTSGMFVRKKVEAYSKLNIYAISEFLAATRVLSLS